MCASKNCGSLKMGNRKTSQKSSSSVYKRSAGSSRPSKGSNVKITFGRKK